MDSNTVQIRRASLYDLSRELDALLKADPFKAVYWKGRMVSPTLPDVRMKY